MMHFHSSVKIPKGTSHTSCSHTGSTWPLDANQQCTCYATLFSYLFKHVQSQHLFVYQTGISILFFTSVDQKLACLGCRINILVALLGD
jgi:hypothetical protein